MPTTSFCPFCGNDQCKHFIGWTEDGRTVQTVAGDGAEVCDGDRIVNTGVSARVYRPAFDVRVTPAGRLAPR